MDVPELTDELVDKIAAQSDEQSGMHSIRELERIRDNNLVDMLAAQKQRNWGAGELLNQHDARLAAALQQRLNAQPEPRAGNNPDNPPS